MPTGERQSLVEWISARIQELFDSIDRLVRADQSMQSQINRLNTELREIKSRLPYATFHSLDAQQLFPLPFTEGGRAERKRIREIIEKAEEKADCMSWAETLRRIGN